MHLLRPVLLLTAVLLPTWVQAFGFDDVAARARQLAESGYQKPKVALPPTLSSLAICASHACSGASAFSRFTRSQRKPRGVGRSVNTRGWLDERAARRVRARGAA